MQTETKTETIHGWAEKLAIGKAGEEVVQRWLEQHAQAVRDVRDDPVFQRFDIDYLVTDHAGEQHTVEVKTDRRATDKLFIEFQALTKSTAEFWLMLAPKTGKLYCFRRALLLEYLGQNLGRFYVFTIQSGRGGQRWSVQGVAPSITDLMAASEGRVWDVEPE